MFLLSVIWLIRNYTLLKGGHKVMSELVAVAKNLSWDWFGARSKGPIGFDLKD